MQRSLLEQLASRSPDALILLASGGDVVEWGGGAEAIFGYGPDECVGRPLARLIVPEEHAEAQRSLIDETLAEGFASCECVRRRKDGSLLYASVSTRRVETEAGATLVLSAEKDVTLAKVLRDAKLMEARFRELLESTPDGIIMANPTGHIVLANSEAERLFGYGDGELRGVSVDALLPQRFRHAHVGHRSNYFQQPRKRAMGSGLDLSGLRKDGSEFPVEISLSPLRTEASAFVLSAIRDISERKRFEQALQEKNLELAEANQAKDRFMAGMSHELRTPLNAIIGFTGTLLMQMPGPLNAEQARQLGTVRSSARHLLELINDLLDIAKIEAGHTDLSIEEVDAKSLLEEVAASLQVDADAKGLSLRVEAPPHAPALRLDRRALRQVVLNLASNAVKFTAKGEVEIRYLPGGPEGAEIQVRDTGRGLSADDQLRLFSAFTRFGSGGDDAPEGSGLGLHLSRKLAELIGGKIVCRSELGVGSTFSLAFPRR